ncbi:hypothetical protein ACQP2Y_42665 [Actinoplanes sp. CA-051413]|uniref:hypothetical protein n=1 Tax=Actinoplanes sp. CA-051413 TaxID=3239899 RepID=UPI003D987116
MTNVQRREILRGASLSFAGLAGVLGAGAVAATPAVAADRSRAEPALSPLGPWSAEVTIPGQWSDLSLYAFTADGILLNGSNAGAIGIGAWSRTGRNRFRYGFREYLLSTSGQLEGELRVKLDARFTSADAFVAEGVAEGFDLTGNPTVVFHPVVTARRYGLD